MQEIKVNIQDMFQQNVSSGINDGSSCAEHEPFALQVLDDSMEPEFKKDCIIIIDPTGRPHDGCFVFAKDNQDDYIFRQLAIEGDDYYLQALKEGYERIKIPGLQSVEGIITQRAGTRRSYHKWYSK